MTDGIANTTAVGIDLGPACDNESTGVLVAGRSAEGWKVQRDRAHWVRRRSTCQCNDFLASAINAANVAVIDAPLVLGASKSWEHALRGCPDLTDSMKPTFSGGIAGHMWRAAALRPLIHPTVRLAEIFPAAWFWLCEFDPSVDWKGEDSAKPRKRQWFKNRIDDLKKMGITVGYADQHASADDADALPCVLCAILISEQRELLRLDDTTPPVLFPPRALWDARVPTSVRSLNWETWTNGVRAGGPRTSESRSDHAG